MLRLLFVMITTVLVGLGTGYFLWGTRVAHLTNSLSSMTLEMDTMRERLASPAAGGSAETQAKTADELRVINEGVAAIRQELADQKPLVEKAANAQPAAAPADAAANMAELVKTRHELDSCMADKRDLEVKCAGAAAVATPNPPYPPAPAGAPPVYQPR